MEKAVLKLIYDLNVKYWERGQEEKVRKAISVIKEQFEDDYDLWNELNKFDTVCELYPTFKQDFETTMKIYDILKENLS